MLSLVAFTAITLCMESGKSTEGEVLVMLLSRICSML